jgi:hypothetical protein
MGLSQDRVDRHIKEWHEKLSRTFMPRRAQWPSRLFHHSPIENAAIILNQGRLLSRNDSANDRKLDVAGVSIILNRDRAHNFGRLYFRPRTPTQFWIEGIRKAGDYYNQAHAPTLVMLVFDARQILIQENVRFSTGNMQSGSAPDGADDAFFDTIEFEKVFHLGAHQDSSITFCRCAEVLVPSPMKIAETLTAIVCRSKAERQTLLHELGSSGSRRWRQQIYVSDDLDVFEKRQTFVDTVSLQHDGIVVKLHPAGRPIAIAVEAWDDKGKLAASLSYKELSEVPPSGGAWRFPAKLANGIYRIKITIEGCRAFESDLLLAEGPF